MARMQTFNVIRGAGSVYLSPPPSLVPGFHHQGCIIQNGCWSASHQVMIPDRQETGRLGKGEYGSFTDRANS